MLMAALALAAALTSGPIWPDPPGEPKIEDYRANLRSGAQCQYADGSRAILFRTNRPNWVIFVYRFTDGWNTVSPVELKSRTKWNYDINGGISTYHSFEVAVSDLLAQPRESVSATTFRAYMRRTHVHACERKAFDLDLYEGPQHPIRGLAHP